jgi:hypothetical protein
MNGKRNSPEVDIAMMPQSTPRERKVLRRKAWPRRGDSVFKDDELIKAKPEEEE